MITRRRFLALVPAALAARLHAQSLKSRIFPTKPRPTRPFPHPFVFFGCDTAHAPARGIYVSRFDPVTGVLTTPVLATESLRPAYLATALLHGRHIVYATNEGDEHTSAISSYSMDPGTGGLHLLGAVPSGFAGPCFIALDATARSAYVANYAGSGLSTYRVKADATLSEPVELLDFRKPAFGHHGPAPRQESPHPHSALLSPDNRFLLVNDLGNDAIITLPVDPATARLGPPHVNESRAGSGPRHLAFHPNGRWIYVIHELDSRIDQYLWNTTRGDPAHGVESQALLTSTSHSVSTVDPGFHGTNTAAEVAVSVDGFFLYASNRGEDSLVVFHIDQANGALTFAQRISCGGKVPRHFTLDPTGRWLVCANQNSASVTVFAVHPGTGVLSGPTQTLPIESPMFTLFV